MPHVQVTLWDPSARRAQGDIELDVHPETPLDAVLAALDAALPGRAARGRPTRWYVGRRPIDPAGTMATSPIVPGCYCSAGAPGPQVQLPGRLATRREDGLLYLDRRFAAEVTVPTLRVELPADDASPARGPAATLLTVGLPMLAAAVLAAVMRQPLFLMMALLGPLGSLGTGVLERRQRRVRAALLARRRADAVRSVTEHLQTEQRARQLAAPGPAELIALATGAAPGLWPRTAERDDALRLRLGTADQPASIELSGAVETADGVPGAGRRRPAWPGLPPRVLRDAPLTVDLGVAGVLGLVGEPRDVAPVLRWLLVQLATARAPDDLRLVLVAGGQDGQGAPDGVPELAWTRWLPHLAGDDVPCLVGVDPASAARRIGELRELVEDRMAQRDRHGATGFGDVVAVLVGARALREVPGMARVLHDGPAVGVRLICVDRGSTHEARALVEIDGDGVRLTAARTAPPVRGRADGLAPDEAELVARALCGVRDRLSLSRETARIPTQVRHLDLFGIRQRPTADAVRALWAGRPGPTTRVPIGLDAQGVVELDLVEHGPHTMLGGATGAGKSVLLQTLVTSLLLLNTPEELNLVLVDFKGGSAFLPFARCPHVVALVRSTGDTAADVFDSAAAQRFLASIRTEVRRREAILAPFGGELDAYWRQRTTRGLGPLPRLVIVVDEFARVLETDPAFLPELVAVAGKGRSLGMHLVLATQSLQGKLSAELKNNISLRISLRQNEPADSVEVLDVPDAAALPGGLRGRALLVRTANGRRAEPFQCGYLGAAVDSSGCGVTVRQVPWPAVGLPRPATGATSSGSTELDAVVSAVETAAAGIRAPWRPIRPPLPARIDLDELDATALEALGPQALGYGVRDDPANQDQPIAAFDLAGTERLLVAGGPQQGRTMLVRALVTSLVRRCRPDQAHLYLIERLPGGLADLAELPHCGAVVGADDPERLRRLVEWCATQVERRRRSAGRTWPAVLVVVDGWEVFEHRADPAFVETSLLGTMRELVVQGPAVGLHVVVTGGPALAVGRTAELFGTRLLLPFPREEDRRAAVAPGVALPVALPGRAVDAATGHQVQCWCTPGELGSLAAAERDWYDELDPGLAPVSIPPLPQRVELGELGDRDGVPEVPGTVRLGLGGARVEPVTVPLLDDGPGVLLVSGGERSGRSTALLTIAESLLAQGIAVLAIASPRSPVARLDGRRGVQVVPGPTVTDEALRAAAGALAGPAPRFVVVADDVQHLTVVPTVTGYAETPTLLEEIADDALGRCALVLAGDAIELLARRRRVLTPIVERVIGSGNRLVLNPSRAMDAREHGLTLEPDQLIPGPPGRGYLARGRTVCTVQVALPGVGTNTRYSTAASVTRR